MTIEIKGTRNYSATVIRVPKVRKAENSDRLYIIDVMGITAIVDDSWLTREGELALLFPAEVQLEPGFMKANNLYRDKELNDDKTQAGYIDTNRRVRAMKLRGNISNGLVMPLHSLYQIEHSALSEGDVFDTINGYSVCRKYVVPVKEGNATRAQKQLAKAFKRVDDVYLPQHFETGQWLREEHTVKPEEELIITQKLHGTSVRLANTIVKRQLKWYEKVAQKLGVKVADHEYDLVAGSKKVIKDPNNPNQQHFYGSDVWTDALEDFGQKIPKNHIVYGELVGFTSDGSPIQKGHTYECDPEGVLVGEKTQLYVYRVAIITEDAELVDLTWDQVRTFCERHGFDHVPELDRMPKAVFDVMDFNELDFRNEWIVANIKGDQRYTDQPVRLSDGGTGKDEGIAIRVDRGLNPLLFKYKNKSHYLYESDQLDTGEADLESEG